MSKMMALARRELIENRGGILATPLILMGLMLIMVFGTLGFSFGDISVGTGVSVMSFGELLEEIADKPPEVRAGLVVAFLGLMTLPALIVLPIVVFFVLLGGLYEERRDRSFLFWKSMPVSDLEEVLSRLAAGILIAPLAFLVIGMATHLLTLFLASLIGALQGGPIGALWQLPTLAINWVHSAFILLMWMLWALPVFAWVLLCGAYAPRMPFMYAVVPPVGLIIVEHVFLKGTQFADWLGHHLSAQPLFNDLARSSLKSEMAGEDRFEQVMVGLSKADFSAIFASLGNPDFWLGIAISVPLIAGAVWLRRHNL